MKKTITRQTKHSNTLPKKHSTDKKLCKHKHLAKQTLGKNTRQTTHAANNTLGTQKENMAYTKKNMAQKKRIMGQDITTWHRKEKWHRPKEHGTETKILRPCHDMPAGRACTPLGRTRTLRVRSMLGCICYGNAMPWRYYVCYMRHNIISTGDICQIHLPCGAFVTRVRLACH